MAPGIDNVKLFVILRMKHAAALYPFAITWISYQHGLEAASTNPMFMQKNRRVGMSPFLRVHHTSISGKGIPEKRSSIKDGTNY